MLKPPIPFRGNKSKIRKNFMKLLNDEALNDDYIIYVDLFGGSLYISYLIHQMKPNNRIICNDYDNYIERLINIDKTNDLLNKINEIIQNNNIKYAEKIDIENTLKIKQLIQQTSYLDINTISSNLLYSGSGVNTKDELLNKTYYNRLNNNSYNINKDIINNYIEGLEIVRCDWYELYNKYRDNDKVLFIADPPYFNTDCSGYKNKNFSIQDTLQTLDILKHEKFIYCTSPKSLLLEILAYLKSSHNIGLHDYTVINVQKPNVNKTCKKNDDVILYRF